MVKLTYFDIIKKPRTSSKAMALNKNKKNKLVVDVHLNSTKADIKVSIERLFGTKVSSINTIIVKGKSKKSAGKYKFVSKSYKKAIITLKDGQALSQLESNIDQNELESFSDKA
jgi:large subunit ribosomal protein L23